MIVTEEQAKRTWCPMSRSLYQGGAGGTASNRTEDGGIDLADTCIGPACMMWRWMTPPPRRLVSSKPIQGWEHVSAEDSGEGVEAWHEPEEKWLARHKGWCGLAGVPNA